MTWQSVIGELLTFQRIVAASSSGGQSLLWLLKSLKMTASWPWKCQELLAKWQSVTSWKILISWNNTVRK